MPVVRRLAVVLTLVLVFALTSVAHATRGGTAGADAVIAWNANASDAAIAACISPSEDPLHEVRMYAMAHAAIHDALNAIDRRYQPYAWDGRAKRGASPDAAVAAAARGVLAPLLNEITDPFPAACGMAGVANVEADYQAALGAIPGPSCQDTGHRGGSGRCRGHSQAEGRGRLGHTVDRHRLRAGHRSWRVALHARLRLRVLAGMGRRHAVRADGRLAVPSGSAVRADGPAKYTADFNEVKRLGGDGITTPSARTADQTEIARFWIENSPLQWNRIARSVAAPAGLDQWESARLFGLLNLALADGYIGSFDTKFAAYGFWRPVTAIRLADTDGNPDTVADPNWTPLDPTPPVPDHDSGHSTEGGAATQVLQRFFGGDRVRFEVCSYTLPPGSRCDDPTPVYRSYSSFSQAREENGLSRVLVGYHFPKAVKDGINHGRKIGDEAVDRFLRPVRRGHDQG